MASAPYQLEVRHLGRGNGERRFEALHSVANTGEQPLTNAQQGGQQMIRHLVHESGCELFPKKRSRRTVCLSQPQAVQRRGSPRSLTVMVRPGGALI